MYQAAIDEIIEEVIQCCEDWNVEEDDDFIVALLQRVRGAKHNGIGRYTS